jgi:hypothetical protein
MMFLVGILILLLLEKQDLSFIGFRRISNAIPAEMDLNAFARGGPREGSSKKTYSFSEESAVSMTHRYNGKFDIAILSWNTGPILEAMIERKFPRSFLPGQARPEDIFQASLYSLALKEKGISCTSAYLIVIYCLQEMAIKCMKNQDSLDCVQCDEGKVFKVRYNEKKTLKQLGKLDEVWYEGRKPEPKPTIEHCRACPFSKGDQCKYSTV